MYKWTELIPQEPLNLFSYDIKWDKKNMKYKFRIFTRFIKVIDSNLM